MSTLQPQTIHVIAESVAVGQLSDEAAKALAPHVDVRLREVVQDAAKLMRHAKRGILTTEDVNNALRLRNVQPLYGFASKDSARFLRAAGHGDPFYVQDSERSFDQVIGAPLPKVPIELLALL
ncbi:hypothetical protein WJX81_001006 [Elliptochloris bilobata]|uniref:TATA box binding protein associated factor (TAF) histone-like fold domain-containing protein n=1 Tax=Elliptochloris bilobata TaxID=381761 RepID=A0AAW1SE21_9CHLO